MSTESNLHASQALVADLKKELAEKTAGLLTFAQAGDELQMKYDGLEIKNSNLERQLKQEQEEHNIKTSDLEQSGLLLIAASEQLKLAHDSDKALTARVLDLENQLTDVNSGLLLSSKDSDALRIKYAALERQLKEAQEAAARKKEEQEIQKKETLKLEQEHKKVVEELKSVQEAANRSQPQSIAMKEKESLIKELQDKLLVEEGKVRDIFIQHDLDQKTEKKMQSALTRIKELEGQLGEAESRARDLDAALRKPERNANKEAFELRKKLAQSEERAKELQKKVRFAICMHKHHNHEMLEVSFKCLDCAAFETRKPEICGCIYACRCCS